MIQCPHPFGEFNAVERGGREYRGLRTRRYTYVRDLNGPWLLYDNLADPYQLSNLVGNEAAAAIRRQLDTQLDALLDARGDEFLPGEEYIKQWGYETDETGTVPFTW